MKNILAIRFVFLIFLTALISCSHDDPHGEYVSYESPVNYDLEAFPYEKLSDYNFFKGDLQNQDPVIGVVPYKPISSLFTDYAKKMRFIWMPENSSANFVSDYEVFDFPVGTILIKSFYYDHVLPSGVTKFIETRLLIKKPTGWIFSDYVWNEDQTEAVLDTSGSFVSVSFLEAGITKTTNYRIPSVSECMTCHKVGNIASPIGVKPQNINSNYTYPSGDVKNQLQKLQELGYLRSFNTSSISTVVDWKDSSKDLSLRARSYLDANCAHCHSDDTHCSYRPIRLSFHDTEYSSTNLGLCVLPDEDIDASLTHIVSPGRFERSVLSYRMNSTEESIKMPLIGRNLVDESAVSLINEWIDSLTEICE
ncbi:putative repeat protein (TIGR03806 family) [Oceanihabitans sediminis]|uniref:Repeat protein (TIGR03806 family) n=1 Tax=Oceanihabitans sediminis TaxID=1812012 RepID=A0A368P7L2_9FLAO|nr:hypothetical protein [Oceanihabitans sediminis]MDX1773193.1 hypothetical protein [Oceanihabitans sediminis]RBP34885.1 putative repeat protein (TIGR03806 family) [Oceanihabitans sediminis]RCU58528.1 hypothetical protein DU428_03890 [Oceanihabitans sediminis]